MIHGKIFSQSTVSMFDWKVDKGENAISEEVRTLRDGNVLFNDTHNTFYLQLYGVEPMVKDLSDSERGNPLPPQHGLFFLNKGIFICTISLFLPLPPSLSLPLSLSLSLPLSLSLSLSPSPSLPLSLSLSLSLSLPLSLCLNIFMKYFWCSTTKDILLSVRWCI